MDKEVYEYECAKSQLEEIIDIFGIADTAYTLATICHDKAEYARSNFDNEIIANGWERCAEKVTKLANEI